MDTQSHQEDRPMRIKHKTAKVKISFSHEKCKITPSVVRVDPGDSLEFKKPSRATICLQFSGVGRSGKVKKGIQSVTMKVAKSVRAGRYPYAAFWYEEGAFCTGSSMPIIIVPRLI